ncbi:MAG: DNA repair protein RecO [Clostridiales bacterium]|nr:DNA repair protein RecO [Clostridiales bacterium]
MLIKTEGFVIRNIKYSEHDSIITIFTRELGKVSAIAKGVRRPKSKMRAGIQPFSYSDFVLYKGRNLYTVNQCNSIEIFYSLREDLFKLSYASYLLELIGAVITEEQTNNRLFNLLGKALYMLKKKDIEINTIVRTFELQFLEFSGLSPNISSCVECGSEEISAHRFSHREGGLLCEQCIDKDRGAVEVSKHTIRLANYLLNADMKKITKLKISELLNNDLSKITRRYILEHTNVYEFKSLKILEGLTK